MIVYGGGESGVLDSSTRRARTRVSPGAWLSSGAILTAELREVLSKVALGSLMLVLAYRIWLDFAATGRVTGVLMLISELLVVALTIVRRRPVEVDRSWDARLVTLLSVAGPPLLRPVADGGLVSDAVTATVSAAGLVVIIAGKFTLGRSFGLMPANRGIVSSGIYRMLRHPIYAGYVVCHLAFLAAHPTARNLIVFIAADAALLVRSLYEERTLRHDLDYMRYCETVKWRVVPGIF